MDCKEVIKISIAAELIHLGQLTRRALLPTHFTMGDRWDHDDSFQISIHWYWYPLCISALRVGTYSWWNGIRPTYPRAQTWHSWQIVQIGFHVLLQPRRDFALWGALAHFTVLHFFNKIEDCFDGNVERTRVSAFDIVESWRPFWLMLCQCLQYYGWRLVLQGKPL